jgi:hypothetical protein
MAPISTETAAAGGRVNFTEVPVLDLELLKADRPGFLAQLKHGELNLCVNQSDQDELTFLGIELLPTTEHFQLSSTSASCTSRTLLGSIQRRRSGCLRWDTPFMKTFRRPRG